MRVNNVLVLGRLVFTNVPKDLLIGGRSRVLDWDRAERYLLAVRSPLFSLRRQEGSPSPWRGRARLLRAAASDGKYFSKQSRATSNNSPGAP